MRRTKFKARKGTVVAVVSYLGHRAAASTARPAAIGYVGDSLSALRRTRDTNDEPWRGIKESFGAIPRGGSGESLEARKSLHCERVRTCVAPLNTKTETINARSLRTIPVSAVYLDKD